MKVQRLENPGGTFIRYIVSCSAPSHHMETVIMWLDFKIVHWRAVAETIPAMLALTFFGVLHVPINVPALAFSLEEDNVSLDRELIAHGVSNALSGALGSIQNYLVYTNSLVFMRTGGDGRLAGIMVAILTAGVLVIGPVLIGYIPVMMVGTLIFNLGFDLFKEAILDTRKKLGLLEYLTVSSSINLGIFRQHWSLFCSRLDRC